MRLILAGLLSLIAQSLFAASPSAPTGLTATVISASKTDLSWSGTGGTYKIERAKSSEPWTQIATTTNTSFRVERLKPSTHYKYRVNVTTAGGTSGYSSIASATTIADSIAPTTPTGLQVTVESCSSINIFWNASTDADSGVASYKIYRAGSYLKTVSAPAVSTIDTGLPASSTICYGVAAVDVSGNESAVTSSICEVTPACPETVPPFTPTGLTATPISAPGCGQIAIEWNQSTDNVGGSGMGSYRIYRNSVLITSVDANANPTVTYTDKDLTASTLYSYRVSAVDLAGNASPQSSAASATTPSCADVTAPSVPTGLVATAQAACWLVTLDWNNSTDAASGVRGYRVYRNGVFDQFVVASQASDADLTGSTLYSWTVSAIDNAGNESAQSSAATATTGSCFYAKRFGGTGVDVAKAVKVNAPGRDILVGGNFNGTVTFDTGPLTSAGGYDIVLSHYEFNGTAIWTKRFGSTGDETVQAMAISPSGEIILAGTFSGSCNFGSGVSVASQLTDIWVAKYTSEGDFLWSKTYGGVGDDQAFGVATDSFGNIIVTGFFMGQVNFGDVTLFSQFSGQDTFILKLTSAGGYVFAKKLTCGGPDRSTGVAVDPSNNIVVCGYYSGSMNAGGGVLVNNGTSASLDMYIAKFDSGGTHLWSKSVGGAADDKASGVAVDSSGNVLLLGLFRTSANVGGATIPGNSANGTLIVKYSPTGIFQWGKAMLGATDTSPSAITVDPTGAVATTGYFTSSIDLGAGSISTTGGQDVFWAKHNSAGTFVWGEKFGSTSNDQSFSISLDDSGRAVMAGYFQGAPTFHGTTLTSAGSLDGFVTRRND